MGRRTKCLLDTELVATVMGVRRTIVSLLRNRFRLVFLPFLGFVGLFRVMTKSSGRAKRFKLVRVGGRRGTLRAWRLAKLLLLLLDARATSLRRRL